MVGTGLVIESETIADQGRSTTILTTSSMFLRVSSGVWPQALPDKRWTVGMPAILVWLYDNLKGIGFISFSYTLPS